MKIHISQPLKSYTGEVIRTGDGESEVATLKSTLEIALVNAKGDDGDRKYELYKLLQRIHAAEDTVEISAEEISTLKKLVGPMFGTVVIGAVFDALEGRVTQE